MSFPVALRAKTAIMVPLIVLFGSTGNILLSRGMKQLGAVRVASAMDLVRLFTGIFSSGWIWMGIGALLLFLGCFMVVLSWADYSYVAPASATVFAVVPLVGHFLLGEKVAPLHWVGILIICVGVGLVGHTAPSTTRQQ
ncbi:MAG: EamA family transporter [Terriglobia bacterium]|jgi:drug/metabolite transporter (DMT)-like permease